MAVMLLIKVPVQDESVRVTIRSAQDRTLSAGIATGHEGSIAFQTSGQYRMFGRRYVTYRGCTRATKGGRKE